MSISFECSLRIATCLLSGEKNDSPGRPQFQSHLRGGKFPNHHGFRKGPDGDQATVWRIDNIKDGAFVTTRVRCESRMQFFVSKPPDKHFASVGTRDILPIG